MSYLDEGLNGEDIVISSELSQKNKGSLLFHKNWETSEIYHDGVVEPESLKPEWAFYEVP